LSTLPCETRCQSVSHHFGILTLNIYAATSQSTLVILDTPGQSSAICVPGPTSASNSPAARTQLSYTMPSQIIGYVATASGPREWGSRCVRRMAVDVAVALTPKVSNGFATHMQIVAKPSLGDHKVNLSEIHIDVCVLELSTKPICLTGTIALSTCQTTKDYMIPSQLRAQRLALRRSRRLSIWTSFRLW